MQCPNFNALTMVSLCAAIMSITYSTIAFGASVAHGRVPDVQYNLDGFTQANGLFGVWNALGTVAFAYGGHNVVLEIQVGDFSKVRLDTSFPLGRNCLHGVLAFMVLGHQTLLSLLGALSGSERCLACSMGIAGFPHCMTAMAQATLPSPPKTLRPMMNGELLPSRHGHEHAAEGLQLPLCSQ